MKKLLVLLMAAAFIMPTFQSCKKGENDPFISLKTRKARLCQTWKLTSATGTSTSGSSMSTYTFNGTTWTTIQSGQSYSFQLTWTLTFDKAGTYTETITAIGSGNSLYTETNKGNWWFGAKNKNAEYKNKETVVMQETSSTNSNGNAIQYSGVDCPLYLKILDKLSSKEMVTIEDGSTTSTSINNSTGIYTWEKQ